MKVATALATAGLMAVGVSWLFGMAVPYDVVGDVNTSLLGAPPGLSAWLGTDPLGRDVAWRLAVATHGFVGPTVAGAALALGVGVPAGLGQGLLRGIPALAAGAPLDITGAVPQLVIVLLACAVFGGSPWVIGASAGLAHAPAVGAVVAQQAAALRARGVFEAGRVHRVPLWRLIFVHTLWGATRAGLARQVLRLLSLIVVFEATLSYLGGFGVSEPAPSWGNMLAIGLAHPGGNPLAWLAPAAATWALVACCGRVSDALAGPARV
jgi:peptide/nickel transport system permease protein